MNKLDELVEMAKEVSSKRWFLNADEEVTAVDNNAGPDDSEEVFIGCAANIQLAKYISAASPETILAIAEAFRALEQENILLKQGCENNPLVHEMIDWRERAEAAEAECSRLDRESQNLSSQLGQCDRERRAALAKLAELEKQDYFGSLVSKARISADKAMVKFPQPNYVLLKVAEEAGEVVQAGVHYAEGRMKWDQLEGEVVQLLAMLIRLVTEGDQVNGAIPPQKHE